MGRSFCKEVFCSHRYWQNLKSIFLRREGSLEPLDGLRACAILWVIVMHVQVFSFGANDLKSCFQRWPLSQMVQFGLQGSMGVDIFFFLSGFLIAHILLKECDKYEGKIDVWNFYRSRSLRIHPLLVAYCVSAMFFGESIMKTFGQLTIINNLIGPITHIWSVGVELQFYIFSPMMVSWMHRTKPSKVWLLPVGICLVSTIANVLLISFGCHGLISLDERWSPYFKCDNFYKYVYFNTVTRMSLYGFGLYVGYLYNLQTKILKNDELNEMYSQFLFKWQTGALELLAFIILMLVSQFGQDSPQLKFNALTKFVILAINRQLFGLSLAYITFLGLNPRIDEISWYRPARFVKWFLSLKVWVPIATLSYSMYLYHLGMMFVYVKNTKYYQHEIKEPVDQCQYSGQWEAFKILTMMVLQTVGITALVSVANYIFIEKPFLDARKVFKNKYQN